MTIYRNQCPYPTATQPPSHQPSSHQPPSLCVAFGDNRDGQCDIPALAAGKRYIGAVAGAAHTILIRDDGLCDAFGDNPYGCTNIREPLNTARNAPTS